MKLKSKNDKIEKKIKKFVDGNEEGDEEEEDNQPNIKDFYIYIKKLKENRETIL